MVGVGEQLVPGPPPGSSTVIVANVERSAAALDELEGRPVAEHVARYDALHGELSEALASIDGL